MCRQILESFALLLFLLQCHLLILFNFSFFSLLSRKQLIAPSVSRELRKSDSYTCVSASLHGSLRASVLDLRTAPLQKPHRLRGQQTSRHRCIIITARNITRVFSICRETAGGRLPTHVITQRYNFPDPFFVVAVVAICKIRSLMYSRACRDAWRGETRENTRLSTCRAWDRSPFRNFQSSLLARGGSRGRDF